MYTLLSAENPLYTNESKTAIDLFVVFEEFPNEALPFTAAASDPEPYGREIFERANAAEFGIVGAYIKPTTGAGLDQPTTTGTQTL